MMLPPLAPNSTIGILGGGQLGRMLAQAAAQLGLKTHIYCPDADAPASQVAEYSQAAYDDMAALDRFANEVARVTYEFENVPAASAARLAQHCAVFPPPAALDVAQDRLAEKQFLQKGGIATADFAAIDNAAALQDFIAQHGRAIVKTRKGGYDGKGQWRVESAEACQTLWPQLTQAAAKGGLIAETVVAFEREISLIIARGQNGDTAAYDPIENTHENHILRRSTLPARLPAAQAATARRMAEEIAARLDYVGVLAVEMFACADALLVNELAPRVHNSGHLTMDACLCGQFEQHIRAIAGWPLGDTRALYAAEMTNLLGAEAEAWRDHAQAENSRLHLYGKSTPRAGRKMGHVTRLFAK